MEYIRVLCCGKKEGGVSNISEILEQMNKKLDIEISKTSGVCLADFTQTEIDEEDEHYTEYYEPFEITCEFRYKGKEIKMHIERITKSGRHVFLMEISFLSEDSVYSLDNSIWYEFKEKLLYMLHGNYAKIFWLADSQNTKMATLLYGKLNELENYLREIINRYMSIIHGGNWFEAYSYEDYILKYTSYSDWFVKSRYNLFKITDNHLFNLEISDIFELLKTAKKKQVSKLVEKALKDIKTQVKDGAEDIANIDILEEPSLWQEEEFDKVFSKSTVKKWEGDLSKRRNMIAHNKMLCRDFFNDTLETIDDFNSKFLEAEEILKNRIKSEEVINSERLRKSDEIAMNLEYCEINPELPDEQDIIDSLNDKDSFIELSGLINDELLRIPLKIDDILAGLEDIAISLHMDNFFENNVFIGKELLEQYIDLADTHFLYQTWKNLLTKEVSVEIYELIEPSIKEYIYDLKCRLEQMKNSVFYVDLNCFSEGDLVRVKDFEKNEYSIKVKGWFCQERGSWNELSVEWICNDESVELGGIFVSYGDYEMSEDGIPLPCVEDEVLAKFDNVNAAFREKLDEISDKLSEIENKIISIEI